MSNGHFVNSFLKLLENDTELNHENIDEFIVFFQKNSVSESSEILCKIISEIAKSEYGRNKCSSNEIITFLISNLWTHRITEDAENLTWMQSCRAIGNICFDNDNARIIVYNLNGLEKLLELLKLVSTSVCSICDKTKNHMNDVDNNSDNNVAIKVIPNGYEEIKEGKNNQENTNCLVNDLMSPLYHLRVCLACIFNVINDNEILSEKAVNLEIIKMLQFILEKSANESIMDSVLNILDFFLDFEFSRSKIIEKKMLDLITDNILHNSDDVIEHTLQIMANMVESDAEKMVSIEGGVYPKLLKLIEMRKNRCSDKILQLAADFIVLLLNGDASMKYLYENGVGKVALDWIESSNNELLISGAFALSNVARSDETCEELMRNNIVEIILKALDNLKPEDIEKYDLQHALISILRNLAVPGFNKEELIKQNIIDKILPFLYSSSDAVTFKSIITIRLLVDKHNLNRTKLLTNHEFLQHLIRLTKKPDNNSIQCEALRLLSYIIIQCDDVIIIKDLYDNATFDDMCEMMTSKHHVMIIEALQALDIFIQIIPGDIHDSKLRLYGLNICNLIANLSTEESSFKLMVAILTILKSNIQNEQLKNYFLEVDIYSKIEAWSKLQCNQEMKRLCTDFFAPI